MIETALLALGLVLVVEGLVYALAPSLVEQMLLVLSTLPQEKRRMLGLGAIAFGLVLLWVAKGLGA